MGNCIKCGARRHKNPRHRNHSGTTSTRGANRAPVAAVHSCHSEDARATALALAQRLTQLVAKKPAEGTPTAQLPQQVSTASGSAGGQLTLAQQVEAEAQRQKTLMRGAEAKKLTALAEEQTVLGKVLH